MSGNAKDRRKAERKLTKKFVPKEKAATQE